MLYLTYSPKKLQTSARSFDFAKLRKDLVDIYCREADIIRLVVDNLNIHNRAALYEVFEPQEARRIVQKARVSLHPKTCQLALTRWRLNCPFYRSQCLERRIGVRAACPEGTLANY
jgi:hypothetical protein